MRQSRRFEYHEYIVEVVAQQKPSGLWGSSYQLLKEGEPVGSKIHIQLGDFPSRIAAENWAVQESMRAVDEMR